MYEEAYRLYPNNLLSRKKFGILGLAANVATLAIAYNRVKHGAKMARRR